MQSKQSTDFGKAKGFIAETGISTPHPPGARQVPLGSCPKVSANPNACTHACWHNWVNQNHRGGCALAHPGVQQRWWKPLTRYDRLQGQGPLLPRVGSCPTKMSQLGLARAHCILLSPTGSAWLKLAMPSCPEHVKYGNSLEGEESEDL